MAHLKVIESDFPYGGSTKKIFGIFDIDARRPHLAGTAFILRKALLGARTSTLRTYANLLAPFLQFVENDVAVKDWENVSDEYIHHYFSHVLIGQKGLAGQSLQLVRTVITLFYDWALSFGWTQRKRFISKGTIEALRDRVEIEVANNNSIDKYRLFSQYISEGEFDDLISWVSMAHEFEKVRDIICLQLGYLSGWRRSEVVDPANMSLKKIKAAMKAADKKGDLGMEVAVIGKGKGGGKARTTYIPPQLREQIERFIQGPLRRSGSHGLLIAKRDGSRLGDHHCSYLFNKARKALQVGSQDFESVSGWLESMTRCFHSLRHSYATNTARHLRINNLPIHLLQDLMGHKDLGTTMTYVHLDALLFKDQGTSNWSKSTNKSDEKAE